MQISLNLTPIQYYQNFSHAQQYLLMASKQFPSEAHLLELIQNRKFKQYKLYIQQIENQQSQAEEAVTNALLHVLVQKKYKDPILMFNTLVLYKQVLVGATMDFICFQDIFPPSIHLEIMKICEYKATQKDLKIRGNSYFDDLFKLPLNQQSKSYGYNYVMLALQLLKSMAIWYPFDYENKKQKSLFKQHYDRLIEKKAYFPQHKDFLLIKPADTEIFKKNYQRFLDNLRDVPEEPEKPKQVKKDQPKINKPKQEQLSLKAESLKISSPPQLRKDPTIPTVKNQTTSQSKVIVEKLINPAKVAEKKPQVVQKLNVQNRGSVDNKGIQMIKIPSSLLQSKRNMSNLQKSDNSEPSKEIQSIKQKPIFFNDKIEYFGNTFNVYPEGSLKPSFKLSFAEDLREFEAQPKKNAEVPLNKLNQTAKKNDDQRKKKQIGSTLNFKPTTETNIVPKNQHQNQQIQSGNSIPQNIKNKKQTQRQIKIKVIQEQEIEEPKKQPKGLNQTPFSFNNKHSQQLKLQTPKKIAKIQKPKYYQSNQNSPQQNMKPQFFVQNYQKNSVVTKRPRSMPKTQKKLLGTTIDFGTVFGFTEAKKVIGLVSPFSKGKDSKQKDVFTKTLSYFTSQRKATFRSNQLQKYNSLLQVVEKMRLDKYKIPYVSKYYEPVTPAMTMLREQSLNLYGSGSGYNPFYLGKGISARLIKQIDNQFVLTLHNLSSSTLLIQYFDMHEIPFSKRIKILTWANNKQPSPYHLHPNQYLDIKFYIELYDLNFKFLNFCVKVDGINQQFMLPVTLLDMCEIQNAVALAHLQKYALKGSIITSQPFKTSVACLPSFLGGYKFSQSESARQRLQNSPLIGQCGLKFQKSSRYGNIDSDLHILVKQVPGERVAIQIEVLYITKDSEAEDLAKVILYLLIFLLNSE